MTNRIWHENKSKLKKSYFQNVRKIYGKETVFFFFFKWIMWDYLCIWKKVKLDLSLTLVIKLQK